MDPARPLKSVFADLAAEDGPGHARDEVLAANGHPNLPDGLVAEAVVNYADTAPFEVAEHLAAYVQANSAVPQSGADAAAPEPDWYGLLTTAPPVTDLAAGPDALDAEMAGLGPTSAPSAAADHADPADLRFGHGGHEPAPVDEPDGLPGGDEPPGAPPTADGFAGADPSGLDGDTLGPGRGAPDQDGDEPGDDPGDLDLF